MVVWSTMTEHGQGSTNTHPAIGSQLEASYDFTGKPTPSTLAAAFDE